MKSMTGYGRATAPLGSRTLTVQVSSVNRKTLDLCISMPEEWDPLEPAIGEAVRAMASRGKINVRIELTGTEATRECVWSEEAVAASLDKLAEFSARRGVAFAPTSELIWSIANSQRKQPELPSAEEAQPVLLQTLKDALKAFAEMRAREGATLLADLSGRTALLRGHMDGIAERAPLVPPAYRETLNKRLREAGLEIALDDERVLKEIALFADRCDITEEITRFRSHLEQFDALLRSDGEIGRKAEFILQELGRETNTTGAKGNDITISRHVIELKNELERIREQIANVE